MQVIEGKLPLVSSQYFVPQSQREHTSKFLRQFASDVVVLGYAALLCCWLFCGRVQRYPLDRLGPKFHFLVGSSCHGLELWLHSFTALRESSAIDLAREN